MENTNEDTQIVQSEMSVNESSERAHMDVQIVTAKKYPRNLQRSIDNTIAIVTMDKDIAVSCGYSLPRAGKQIAGPSVHLARILAAQYGNFRAECKVTQITDKHIISQGIAFDLENNYAVKVEVRRKITDRNGNRFNEDMITVTGNAANAISFRNAVFNVIGMNVVDAVYKAAQNAIKAGIKDLSKELDKMFATFKKEYAVEKADILTLLSLTRPNEVTEEHIVTLRGLYQALKSGDTTVADTFGTVVDNTDTDTDKQNSKLFDNDGKVK